MFILPFYTTADLFFLLTATPFPVGNCTLLMRVSPVFLCLSSTLEAKREMDTFFIYLEPRVGWVSQ